MMKSAIVILLVVCSIEAKKRSPQVKIINGEEENSKQDCAMVCSGSTGMIESSNRDLKEYRICLKKSTKRIS